MQSLSNPTTHTAVRQIGRLLRELRAQQHLTGEQLAHKAGTSQSRISKIESGHAPSIDAPQIGALLDILNAPKLIRQQVSMLLFQTTDAVINQIVYPFTDLPEVLNDLQKLATTFRCYVVGGISAVLQTSEYRLAYLRRLGFSQEEARLELGRTIERQDALWDTSKTFYIVMPETALYTLPADTRIQIAQMDRLERIIGSGTVHLGIIPTQAGVSVFETGTFTFYDDQILYATVGDRVVKVQDNEALLKYTNAFNELSQLACFDGEAIALIRRAADYFAGSR